MKFHAPTGRMTIDIEDLEQAALGFKCVLVGIRKAHGLPLTPYKRDSALTEADHTQKALIDAAASVGIDMGARWGNEIDVSGVDQ